jgi:hypothetical protein
MCKECDDFVPFKDEGECEMCGVHGSVWVAKHPEIGLMGFCEKHWKVSA